MTLTELKAKVEQERGRIRQLETDEQELIKTETILSEYQQDVEQAREIFRQVGQQTQQQLEFFISDIVTLAIESIMDNPYKFVAEFVLRRNKTECDLWFQRNEQRTSPLDAAGGGVVDVASFGLRLSLWSLNKNRPVIILDEPFKHLSKDLHPKALQMLKGIAEKLKIQIIMISHSEELVDGADKIYRIKMQEGISYVKEVSQ